MTTDSGANEMWKVRQFIEQYKAARPGNSDDVIRAQESLFDYLDIVKVAEIVAEFDRLQSSIESQSKAIAELREELARERVNQVSFNECAAELAAANAELERMKACLPRWIRHDEIPHCDMSVRIIPMKHDPNLPDSYLLVPLPPTPKPAETAQEAPAMVGCNCSYQKGIALSRVCVAFVSPVATTDASRCTHCNHFRACHKEPV